MKKVLVWHRQALRRQGEALQLQRRQVRVQAQQLRRQARRRGAADGYHQLQAEKVRKMNWEVRSTPPMSVPPVARCTPSTTPKATAPNAAKPPTNARMGFSTVSASPVSGHAEQLPSLC